MHKELRSREDIETSRRNKQKRTLYGLIGAAFIAFIVAFLITWQDIVDIANA